MYISLDTNKYCGLLHDISVPSTERTPHDDRKKQLSCPQPKSGHKSRRSKTSRLTDRSSVAKWFWLWLLFSYSCTSETTGAIEPSTGPEINQ